jgi:integrase/recombinase XerD
LGLAPVIPLLDLETKDKSIDTITIKSVVKGKKTSSFISFFNSYLDELESKQKFGTHSRAKSVLKKLNDYTGDKDLKFDEITLQFIKNYEKYMREDLKNSPNTINANFKIFRKLINDAIREDLLSMEKSPFNKYKLKWVNVEKAFLTDDEIDKICQLNFTPVQKIYHTRNMFIFAIYAAGLRVSDLLQLKWKDFDGKYITVNTQKTNQNISIFLPDKALEILKFYSKSGSDINSYIFPFLSNDINFEEDKELLFKKIAVSSAMTNEHLKTIAQLTEINKHLHFHVSRHSFATKALRKGMRIEYVSKLLGHTSIKTTQIYAKIVNSDLDKAMLMLND